MKAGKETYLKNFVRNKDDPLVIPVTIEEIINPFYARIKFENGRIDTVSTKSLSAGPENIRHSESVVPEPNIEDTDEVHINQTEVASEPENEPDHSNLPYVRPVRDRRPPERLIDQF